MLPRIRALAALLPLAPPHRRCRTGGLRLESGEDIGGVGISCVTHGRLNAAKSNAVLMVTAISGNHHRLDFMAGPGRALDTGGHCVIVNDVIVSG